MVTKDVLFEYVFKRALAELDELLNLDPGNVAVAKARTLLVFARPPVNYDPLPLQRPERSEGLDALNSAQASEFIVGAWGDKYRVGPGPQMPSHRGDSAW